MKEKTTLSDIGARGEERICAVLAAISGARLYRNVYIPRGNGSTVEIDAILLSQKGLIVVECKTFLHGDITGSIQRYEWTRAYWKKGTRYPVRTKFYNPIKQNDAHIEAIIRALGVPRGACHSLIVFAQGAVLESVRSCRKAPCDPSWRSGFRRARLASLQTRCGASARRFRTWLMLILRLRRTTWHSPCRRTSIGLRNGNGEDEQRQAASFLSLAIIPFAQRPGEIVSLSS